MSWAGPRPPPRTSARTPEAGGPQGSHPLYGQRRSDRAMPEDELLGTPDESRLTVRTPRDHAAGVEAVAVAMGRSLGEMGPSRATRTLDRKSTRLNSSHLVNSYTVFYL